MTDHLPSNDLCTQLRALTGGNRLLGYTAAEEIELLRTALRGISTCSTCEACRGAALRALGGADHKPDEAKLISTVEMLREVEEVLIDQGWHSDRGVLKRVTDCLDEVGRSTQPLKPAHEREMPHCSTCACPPYDARAAQPPGDG